MYSNYEFYSDRFEDCDNLISFYEYRDKAEEAAAIIERCTFGRADEVVSSDSDYEMAEKVKMCECRIIDALVSFSSQSSNIVSESNDGYSVSYLQDTEKKKQEKILSICRQYLTFPKNLMYAGV